MKQESSYYVYGSGAPDLQHAPIPPLHLPEELVPGTEDLSKTRRRQQRRETQKRNLLFKLQLLACTMVFFIGCLILMVGYSTVGVQQKNIEDLNKSLQSLQKKNALIESEINRNMDLHALEEKATQQLGMIRPGGHQIIPIEISKSSHTVRHTTHQPRQTKASFLSFFQTLIKGW